MDILSEYKKQLEKDKLVEELEDSKLSDDVRKRIEEIRNDPNSIENQYKRFHEVYTKYTESELESLKLIKEEEVKPIIKRAYCPECGKEIEFKFPIMINPYTNERIGRYDCPCGNKLNLEYSYPRIVFINKDGEEITVQN